MSKPSLAGQRNIQVIKSRYCPCSAPRWRNTSCATRAPRAWPAVRYVHLALVVPSSSSSSDNYGKDDDDDGVVMVVVVEATVCALREEALPALRQLDVEVVMAWGQPRDPGRLRELSLERFLLKVVMTSTGALKVKR
ncbi:hypothetical protein F5X96DRAFT_667485 [Biscogniauxia mediterranea]|nr:hypothetical protein F5X96DRAFT_667485 [Biscogniauxia mediterranea]